MNDASALLIMDIFRGQKISKVIDLLKEKYFGHMCTK